MWASEGSSDSNSKPPSSQAYWTSDGSDCHESAKSGTRKKSDFIDFSASFGMQCAVKNSFICFEEEPEDEELSKIIAKKKLTRSSSAGSLGSRRSSVSDMSSTISNMTSGASGCGSGTLSPQHFSSSGYGEAVVGEELLAQKNTGTARGTTWQGYAPGPIAEPASIARKSEGDSTQHQQEGEAEDGAVGLNENMAVLHASGRCKPCMYINSKVGCMNSEDCRFCHFTHTKKNRPRPCKAKRVQCKQMVGMLQTIFAPDSPEFQAVSARLCSETTHVSYMNSLLRSPKNPKATFSDGGPESFRAMRAACSVSSPASAPSSFPPESLGPM